MVLEKIAKDGYGRAASASRAATVKEGEGHRSIITAADIASNEIIYAHLTAMAPHCRILSEEAHNHPAGLDCASPLGIMLGDVYVVDSLDGTTLYASGLAEWSVGIGGLHNGRITEGSVCSRELSVYAEGNKLFVNGVRKTPAKPVAVPKNMAVVRFGVDAMLYRNIMSILPTIAASVRGVYTIGSGLSGLAQVAAGKIAAVVQTPQKVWDWVPAYRAVVNSGNVFRFFRLIDGKLVTVDAYDYDAFCYKPNEHRLGFVAGEPAMANALLDLLPKTGWERIKPDDVQGVW